MSPIIAHQYDRKQKDRTCIQVALVLAKLVSERLSEGVIQIYARNRSDGEWYSTIRVSNKKTVEIRMEFPVDEELDMSHGTVEVLIPSAQEVHGLWMSPKDEQILKSFDAMDPECFEKAADFASEYVE